MQYEGFSYLAGGRRPSNDDAPGADSLLTGAVIPVPATPSRAAGMVWIDGRHDAHWISASDPDWEHLVELFAHANRLEDAELRSMIEELVAPRLKAVMVEQFHGHPPRS